jgi:acyl-CoA thioesterase-1
MGIRFWRFSTLIIKRFLCLLIRAGLIPGLLLCLSLSAQAREDRILVLGDSISAAYGMSLEQGWVALMKAQLESTDTPAEVFNASISGETTAGGLRRLPELLARHQPNIVVIELGGNDGLRGYPLDRLRTNLQAMVDLSADAGARVILVAMEIPPNYGSRYATGFRDSFTDIAASSGSILAPFLLEGVATNPELMQADGIHPRVEAQPLLLQNILPTIKSVLSE